ncbi:amphi-Trp domain-containing protein [bacterium]|nr:amphi-Trp domain-containing protein [bacterium]MCP5461728.1 amphi-Trp domain-containing protein [bacterium]
MKKEINIDGKIKLNEALSYLNDICSSIKAGTLTISAKKEVISINPEDDVSITIHATQRKKEESVALVLSWKKHEKTITKPLSLSISSNKPEPIEKPETKPSKTEQPKVQKTKKADTHQTKVPADTKSDSSPKKTS